ncbi:uncharacterized protein PHACADRAFT_202592 [Phanerochaete carnosa HHB-10118-sp]|uniref:Chromo domain-containing protein n=1 Tax=Phanerochaete carnosa (strain HHB-10118-sp) TaxID=650164 RepID=K5VBZ2_PHACS|nr:uncharacterized protein PHACADRAFT_202592 [Phanerochaete carnosa HHB-10118-sp]EKM48618.1 hypothetical protein PHACADRAFT_202592 [Phanerochaete carnosa HHB-10118-sp]
MSKVIPLLPVIVNNEEEYKVEKILDSCIYRRQLQYLIKWKEYRQGANKWIPAKDVHAKEHQTPQLL